VITSRPVPVAARSARRDDHLRIDNQLAREGFSPGRSEEFARAVRQAFDAVRPSRLIFSVALRRAAADPGLVEACVAVAGAEHVIAGDTPENLLEELVQYARIHLV